MWEEAEEEEAWNDIAWHRYHAGRHCEGDLVNNIVNIDYLTRLNFILQTLSFYVPTAAVIVDI